MKTIRLIIKGRVHGVGFRYFVQKEAISLGLTGYVKNMENDVLVVAKGGVDNLEKLTQLCRKGPALARVESVEAYDETDEDFEGFRITH